MAAAALTRSLAWLALVPEKRPVRLVLAIVALAISVLFLIPLIALVRIAVSENTADLLPLGVMVAAMAAYLVAVWARLIGGNALLQRSRMAFYSVISGLTIGAGLFLLFAVDALQSGTLHPQNPADLVLLFLTAVALIFFATTLGVRNLKI